MNLASLITMGVVLSVSAAHAHVTHNHPRHASHAAASRHHSPVNTKTKFPRSEFALVSWYGLHDGSGHMTAQGRPFRASDIGIAAPASYPFGTRLRLTVVESGRSIVATVTDRNGPGVARGGRKFDLYYGTAKALGVIKRGTARVLVEAIVTVPDGSEVAEWSR